MKQKRKFVAEIEQARSPRCPPENQQAGQGGDEGADKAVAPVEIHAVDERASTGGLSATPPIFKS
jgi:hypothetical protein